MIIKKLLEKAISYKASDLHLVPHSPALYRINGYLTAMDCEDIYLPGETHKLLSELKKTAFNSINSHPFEADFTYENECGRFRVNVFEQLHGLAATFRVISNTLPTLSQLGLSQALLHSLDTNEGMILVTGKAGMGKSTTLAAMIDYINVRQAKHIITLEDPIEYVHTNKKSLITQREIFSHSHSLNSAIRAALREDPNVIVIGEIRDTETMRLALRAAETGHLVIATLHTHSTTHCINRMMDFFQTNERPLIQQQLADILVAIICQKLIPHHESRIAIFECLISNPAIKHLIRENKIAHIQNVLQTSDQAGMFTFEQFAAMHHLLPHASNDLVPPINTSQERQIK